MSEKKIDTFRITIKVSKYLATDTGFYIMKEFSEVISGKENIVPTLRGGIDNLEEYVEDRMS